MTNAEIAAKAEKIRSDTAAIWKEWVEKLGADRALLVKKIEQSPTGKALLKEKGKLDAELTSTIKPIEDRWTTLRGDELNDANVVRNNFYFRLNNWQRGVNALFQKFSQPIAQSPAVDGGGRVKKGNRGRKTKNDSNALRMAMMGKLRQHHSLKNDVPELAKQVGVDEKTIRVWLEDEERSYHKSQANHPEDIDDQIDREIAAAKTPKRK